MVIADPGVINKAQTGNVRRFVRVVKEVLFAPHAFFAAQKSGATLPNPYIFLAVCTIFHTLMVVLTLKKISFMLVILALANGLLMPLVSAWLLFFIVTRLFNGQGSYEDSLKINVYAGATVLFSWLPMGGFLLEFYRLYLLVVGFGHVFAVRPGKAWTAIVMVVFIYTTFFLGINRLTGAM